MYINDTFSGKNEHKTGKKHSPGHLIHGVHR